MSTTLRSFTALVRACPRAQKTTFLAHTRSFHSPFVVLNDASPLTSPPTATSTVSPITAPVYEKQHDHSPEPRLTSSGTHTYVVSEPDPSNTPYQVPSGAYPTSAPYVMPSPTTAPNPEGVYSSTSASLPHPYTTRAVPQNEAGIGESAAVRYGEAPGEMGRRGGSYGGLGLMSESGTKPGARKSVA
ncbi:hypothetical protein F5I97DRAFT_1489646 [Phlebopus sp. FC_14]|nr:hypothetical protein F5I97DRAFT_1489646 [Phlebopus sp. FC_14]